MRLLAGRYELHEQLGRGGMARVHRATDRATGRTLALKQLILPPSAAERALAEALFEREFHTLAQLQHPRVIAVYDYGVDADGCPFYTMELLDGGDLRERAPLSWRTACELSFDVCSSLALLHSRRLIHRDVTPRNVRCTRDGKAKLIDFGALVPAGVSGARVVGTPAYTPPETLHRQVLDGRADLYSLGATLYYALTSRSPYAATNFGDLMRAWRDKLAPPSAHVADIPPELDDLVLSLLNHDPALRPRSAFDVMQRLAALAGLPSSESDEVSRAYLTTPALVGRARLLADLRAKLSGPSVTLMLSGPTGIGRSRLLDVALLEAKTLGLTVLRATASGALEPGAVVRALLQHLLEALPSGDWSASHPELFAENASSTELTRAVCRVLSRISQTQPLVVAVDDVHRIDQASAAVLAALTDAAPRGRLSLVLTADSAEASRDTCAVLAARSEQLTLAPLDLDETHGLLGSLFGDVANLRMLAGEVHSVALGNPRQCLDMAQHLVDKQSIRYGAGTWTLPSRLSAEDLPRSAEAAMQARIEQLSPEARLLAEAHALAYFEVLAHRDYRALLPDASAARVDLAISELVASQALLCDGQLYTLANRVWSAAFRSRLDASETELRHASLARLFAERSVFAHQYHLFSAGLHEQGIELLLSREAEWDKGFDHRTAQEQNVGKMIWCAGMAAEVAQKLGRSPRQVNQLRRWYVAGLATTESGKFKHAAEPWLRQVKHDSGLELWLEDAEAANPGERLTRALQRTHQRYLDTPEAERVYSVPEALRLLAEYVVVAIAAGARTCDTALLASLPGVLEPFVLLSPALDIIWRNAIATLRCSCECRYAEAHALWVEVLAKLDALTDELQHLDPIRGAVTFAVGIMEAQFGLASAADRAARLDHDPYQRITALQLRKIVRLEQGDWNGADQLRRQAEVLALQVRTVPMFKTLLSVEASAYAKAHDLVGLQHAIEQMRHVAAEFPGWTPSLREAEARFDLVRGDYAAAELGFQQTIQLTAFAPGELSRGLGTWIFAQAGLAETLLATGRVEEARARASDALQICEARHVDSHANDLVRVLALSEAKLGDPRGAERLESLIAAQVARGVTGLRIGMSYEARAQIAIWSDDRAAFEHYSRHTAREYRYGLGCPLAVRYERLLNEAKRRSFVRVAQLADFESAIETALEFSDDVQTKVSRIMSGAESAAERTERALRVLCVAWRARGGCFFARTPEGVLLHASLEALTPATATRLTELVRQFLAHDTSQCSTVQVGDMAYELVPLTSDRGAANDVAGVVALSVSESRPREVADLELVQAVAEHLLEGGSAKR